MTKQLCLTLLIGVFAYTSVHAQFQLVGVASGTNDPNCFILTPEQNLVSGAVWYTQQVDISRPFDVYTQIYLGDNNNDGADGLAFVLQNVSANVGSNGEGLGYQGLIPSLALEFDTHPNEVNSDPSFDHIALVANGVPNHSSTTNLSGPAPILTNFLGAINAEDGNWHQVRIHWNPQTQQFLAFVDCELRLAYTGDIINNVFNGNSRVFWGFTAATGNKRNLHQFCLEYVSFLEELQDTTICEGESVQLNAGTGAGNTFRWTPATGLSNPNISNPIANPSTTTTYALRVTDPCGDTRTDSVTITVQPAIEAEAVADTGSICMGESVRLFATGGDVYTWSPPNDLDNPNIANPVARPLGSTTFTVTVSDGIACSDTASVSIEILPVPDADAGTDQRICEGMSANLMASGGIAYAWLPTEGLSDPAIANPVASPAASTAYTVTVTDANGCSNNAQVNVLVDPLPNVSAGGDQSICEGQRTVLTASGAMDYIWSPTTGLDDPTSPTPTASPATTTTYFLTGTDDNGCTNTDSATIEVLSRPQANGQGSYEICPSTVQELSVEGNDTYLWSTGEAGSSIQVQPGQNATYWVVPVNENCTGDTLYIEVTINEELPILAADLSARNGPAPLSVMFTNLSQQTETYSWNFGDGSFSTDVNPAHTYENPGTYQVSLTGWNALGCEEVLDLGMIEVSEPQEIIPNVFTPNGDGINDTYVVQLGALEHFHVVIFDRWGKLVFESTDPNTHWDGMYKGKQAAPGVYSYRIEAIQQGGVERRLSGMMTLLR